MEHTKELSKFCSEINYKKLPQDVIEKAKLCILDFVANAYGSLELEAARAVEEWGHAQGGAERATVIGCGYKTDARTAAFVNGTLGEALEAQDGLRFGGNHPGAAVIPAALAVAEEKQSSGRAIIEAIVAGYEAANRAAAAVHPHSTLSGFLPTGTCGTLGAAVAAARLMHADENALLRALGVAAYMAPLSMAEHLMGGYTAKIVQGGAAASAGVTAAGLAAAGITAPPYTLEGSHLKGGFIQITTRNQCDADKITEGLGEHFTIRDVYFKPFTSCRHTHGAAQAAVELKNEYNINPDEIKEIIAHTYGIACVAVGKQASPDAGFVSAQFSLPYVAASCLLHGDMGPDALRPERLNDPALHALAAKVKMSVDTAINAMYPDKTATRLEVRMKNGKSFEKQIDIPLGDPRAPMNAEHIKTKLMNYARGRDELILNHIARKILNFEKVENISELAEMLQRV